MKKVYKILKKEKPDVVYQRVLNSFTFYLAKFCKKLNIPFYIHIADNYSIFFDGFKLSTLVRYIFFKKIVKNNANFICQTFEQKSILESKGIKPIEVIQNIPRFHSNVKILPKSERYIISWIGNIRPVKNIEDFLFLSTAINTNYQFHIYGDIPNDKYGNIIRKKIKSSNIIYNGLVSENVITESLKHSIALINTSHSEGFSNTFIEAWLVGTPVISLNSNPNSYFDKNKLGYFCNGDYEKMKNSLISIINLSSYEYELISKSCFNFCKTEFDPELLSIKLYNVFNKLKA
jgi:glycosyltransferase involved in cell wall biosynthesis